MCTYVCMCECIRREVDDDEIPILSVMVQLAAQLMIGCNEVSATNTLLSIIAICVPLRMLYVSKGVAIYRFFR